MSIWREEPELQEVLNDPIVQLVMDRDGVAAEEVLALAKCIPGEREA